MLFLEPSGPLFYKIRRKERMPFPSETKNGVLEDQDYKCAICGRGLSRFNIDFDHNNGHRSDNRSSNCRALYILVIEKDTHTGKIKVCRC